ncbi:uncharacterized protein LOC142579824 isoform X1 [Dermacentor variabilis]|uniref:uncharacterized protein LOC142579824 isoform X1 n=1 Tax=Dermacentor variabilis TaxID=34621 RepID=UPI003F5C92FB
MAEGRRSSRAHKSVNYAKLDYGSDEDDDFKPAEAPPSKRAKPAVKEAPKKAEKKTKPDSVGITSSSAVTEKQKAGRASLDDKLFQRDLEAALRLSQNAPASEGLCLETDPEHKPADSIIEQNSISTFPENLELAGEVVVHSEPGPEPSEPSASANGKEEEDYQPEQEGSSEDEEEDASDEDYGDSRSDDDEEFAPSKGKASRSRKELVAKKPPAAPKKPAGTARAATKKPPAPSAAPHTATKGPATTRGKMQESSASASSSSASPLVPRSAPRLAAAAKSSPSAAPRLLPQRTPPGGNVPMTVPKFSSGQLPASGIRLGLSRRSVSKPLHSVVKVQQ